MKKKKSLRLKNILSFFLFFIFFIMCSFFIFLFLPLPDIKNKEVDWFFYDKNQEILYQQKNIHQDSKTGLEDLFFTKGLINLEDKKFKNHSGINMSSLLRALKQNFFEKKIVSGASTITMQLAKIFYLENEPHNYGYKIKQIFYAFKLENKFSKSEILELYLENINFGNNTKGLREASFKYFSKTPENLSVGESLILLTIIPNPSVYDPIHHPENIEKRKKNILKKFYDLGLLTLDEKNFWELESVVLKISLEGEIIAPHFIFWVQKELKKNFEFREKIKKSSEIHVYTTLDKEKYQKALNISQNILALKKEKNIHNTGVLGINKNQEIEIMLGSPNFFDENIDGAVNMATAKRQTGSVLKPFLYALALENNFSPLDILKDEKQIFESGYFPRNFHVKEFNGDVYFREALVNSYNISAVYLLNQVGLFNFFDFTQKLGIKFSQEISNMGESFILGSGSASLLDLVRGFSVFKNEGVLKNLKFFTHIKNEKAETVMFWQDFCDSQKQKCKPKKIMSQNTADWLRHSLSDISARWKNFSRGNPLELSFQTGSKTGTSQNFSDNWVLGFSSDFTLGVWVGNANGKPMYSSSGVDGSGEMWHKVMNLLQEDFLLKDFVYNGSRKEKIICKDPENFLLDDCSEKFTAFLLDSELEKYKNNFLENNSEVKFLKNKLKIVYPRSGDVFLRDSDLLIQVSGVDEDILEYFLDDEKINSRIIKRLKLGSHKIKVQNKKSYESYEVSIVVE